jgi:hypothetical protein
MVNQLATAAQSSLGPTTGTHQPTGSSPSMGTGGFKALLKRSGDRPLDQDISASDGALSLDVAKQLLEWHAEAVGRMVELTAPSDVCVAMLLLTGHCG